MKIKRIIAGVLASATLLTTTFAVGAEDIDWEMNRNFSRNSSNGVGYMYYHVGQPYNNDDVFAYTETRLASGMTGYASVSLVADNNKKASKYSDKVIKDGEYYYIRTDNAGVSGTDEADTVTFHGARKDKDYVGFYYYLY